MYTTLWQDLLGQNANWKGDRPSRNPACKHATVAQYNLKIVGKTNTGRNLDGCVGKLFFRMH
eukprot:7248582-Karenia_brevis.AAC.1